VFLCLPFLLPLSFPKRKRVFRDPQNAFAFANGRPRFQRVHASDQNALGAPTRLKGVWPQNAVGPFNASGTPPTPERPNAFCGGVSRRSRRQEKTAWQLSHRFLRVLLLRCVHGYGPEPLSFSFSRSSTGSRYLSSRCSWFSSPTASKCCTSSSMLVRERPSLLATCSIRYLKGPQSGVPGTLHDF
jgi:hypothetical protein